MAKKKYYAVRKGKQTGIFYTWEECKQQVDGYSGAEYKSFGDEEEARAYLGIAQRVIITEKSEAKTSTEKSMEIYVDGSYCSETEEFSYGMVVLYKSKEYKFSKKFKDFELAEMHNVAGEIKGAEAAMQYAVDNNADRVVIYHDYEGIAKWCTQEWKATKAGTQAYRDFYNVAKEKVKIEFIKVEGHSNNKYNDLADQLAKTALGISNADGNNEGAKEKMAKSVYIIRNIDKLQELFNETVHGFWPDAECDDVTQSGNHLRYTFCVQGKKALLDIYQKNDGQTTLRPTGANTELSTKVKDAVELRGYRTTSEQKSYSMFIGEEWIGKTVQFLSGFCNGEFEKTQQDDCTRYGFVSEIGDRLTLTVYSNHRVLIQGKPLLLYNEFISYVSYSPKVEMNDIIKATNEFNDTNTDVDAARNKLLQLMPTAYNGSIDDTIWKVFSPAMALMDNQKILEDYSCCVFPALRALEGYLEFLLAGKNIIIDERHNFGTVFTKDSSDTAKYVVTSTRANGIADANYVKVLEDVYNYFNRNRHVIFHMNQIFIDTKIIESRQEAITTVNEVAALIEGTYKQLF